jgi:hypothetical protein
MRHEFAPEAQKQMCTCHRVDQRPAIPAEIELEGRLPIGQSIAVIVGLSALSWATLISLVMAVRAVL